MVMDIFVPQVKRHKHNGQTKFVPSNGFMLGRLDSLSLGPGSSLGHEIVFHFFLHLSHQKHFKTFPMYTPKPGVELHLLVPYLDVASLLDGESAKQWVQHRVH